MSSIVTLGTNAVTYATAVSLQQYPYSSILYSGILLTLAVVAGVCSAGTWPEYSDIHFRRGKCPATRHQRMSLTDIVTRQAYIDVPENCPGYKVYIETLHLSPFDLLI